MAFKTTLYIAACACLMLQSLPAAMADTKPAQPAPGKNAPAKTDKNADKKSPEHAKDTKDSKDKTLGNPYASQVWSADDVKKLCSKQATGPRAYDNCVSRNERRIGRVKQPHDSGLLE